MGPSIIAASPAASPLFSALPPLAPQKPSALQARTIPNGARRRNATPARFDSRRRRRRNAPSRLRTPAEAKQQQSKSWQRKRRGFLPSCRRRRQRERPPSHRSPAARRQPRLAERRGPRVCFNGWEKERTGSRVLGSGLVAGKAVRKRPKKTRKGKG